MKHLLSILCVFLAACSEAVISKETNSPIVLWANKKVQNYYNLEDPLVVDVLLINSVELLEGACHARNISGCNKDNQILINANLSADIQCQTLLHEMNHSVAYLSTGDWDFNHNFHPEFYNEVLFDLCSKKSEFIDFNNGDE